MGEVGIFSPYKVTGGSHVREGNRCSVSEAELCVSFVESFAEDVVLLRFDKTEYEWYLVSRTD